MPKLIRLASVKIFFFYRSSVSDYNGWRNRSRATGLASASERGDGARERHEREEEEEDLNSTFESNSISQMTARLAK